LNLQASCTWLSRKNQSPYITSFITSSETVHYSWLYFLQIVGIHSFNLSNANTTKKYIEVTKKYLRNATFAYMKWKALRKNRIHLKFHDTNSNSYHSYYQSLISYQQGLQHRFINPELSESSSESLEPFSSSELSSSSSSSSSSRSASKSEPSSDSLENLSSSELSSSVSASESESSSVPS